MRPCKLLEVNEITGRGKVHCVETEEPTEFHLGQIIQFLDGSWWIIESIERMGSPLAKKHAFKLIPIKADAKTLASNLELDEKEIIKQFCDFSNSLFKIFEQEGLSDAMRETIKIRLETCHSMMESLFFKNAEKRNERVADKKKGWNE